VTRLKEHAILFGATGAWTGYFPGMPGTVGTLAAVPLSVGLNELAKSHFPLALVILAVSLPVSIWLAGKAAALVRQKDPQIIVIDEIVGFLVTNFSAPLRPAVVLSGFILFRLFDMVKPFPVNRLEALPAGSGIVMDDVMAGVYAFLCVRLMLYMGIL
jgi:phosphatidylglycerophosphatase A